MKVILLPLFLAFAFPSTTAWSQTEGTALIWDLYSWGYPGKPSITTIDPNTPYIMGNSVGAGEPICLVRADGTRELHGPHTGFFSSPNPPPSPIAKVETQHGGFVYLLQDGSLWAEGNSGGHVEQDLPTGNNFVDIGVSRYSGFAVTDTGYLVPFGKHTDWRYCLLHHYPKNPYFKEVTVVGRMAIAIRLDGSLYAWGYANDSGQLTNIPPGNDFIDVAIAYNSGRSSPTMFALRQDGTIEAWGNDDEFRVSEAPTGNGFIQLAGEASTALHSDGSIHSWGVFSTYRDEHAFPSVDEKLFHFINPFGVLAIRDRGPHLATRILYDPSKSSDLDATLRVTDCTPNNQVVVAWSYQGGGPISTAYGPAYISFPFTTKTLFTDNLGHAEFRFPTVQLTTQLNMWFHALDVGSGTLFINHPNKSL